MRGQTGRPGLGAALARQDAGMGSVATASGTCPSGAHGRRQVLRDSRTHRCRADNDELRSTFNA